MLGENLERELFSLLSHGAVDEWQPLYGGRVK